ncbi:hypothetical protein [Yellowstone lake phycodnavirus 3]|uniref:hypothetical protein n=1 Tax=Yellowstone lake phycodnavirus 3 TaxID=1586715 RepID=UPI0006EB8B06|nr:hypothetical protein AR677_gp051 [Yellowstone lake phycodnavirus 3]BAT22550.1 hypothetical protein [Yellowstone lake phycodnavirus 3]
MATITIKIDSEELAREVLTQLGYLPGDDDVYLESDEEEPEVAKPVVRLDPLPESTRNIPVAKQGEFCTTEDAKEDIEPVENEIGAPLDVFSEEMAKERDELYKQCMEVRNSTPSPEQRLKETAGQLTGDELLGYLDAMCDHDDKKMREAVKAMVRKEFAGHTIKMWPNLQKVLDSTKDSDQ